MTKRPFAIALIATAILALAAGASRAQDPPPPPAPSAQPKGLVPLEVQVVISRYQGDKRIASLPYTLSVNANHAPAQLRMGAEVPVPTTTLRPPASTEKTGESSEKSFVIAPMQSFNYRPVGTSIDCRADTADDGRFRLQLTIEDSSVYSDVKDTATPRAENAPVFRAFKATNSLLLNDGQSREFTAATDRISGEVVRVAVTLRVVK